jgi:hypothetical protein
MGNKAISAQIALVILTAFIVSAVAVTRSSTYYGPTQLTSFAIGQPPPQPIMQRRVLTEAEVAKLTPRELFHYNKWLLTRQVPGNPIGPIIHSAQNWPAKLTRDTKRDHVVGGGPCSETHPAFCCFLNNQKHTHKNAAYNNATTIFSGCIPPIRFVNFTKH